MTTNTVNLEFTMTAHARDTVELLNQLNTAASLIRQGSTGASVTSQENGPGFVFNVNPAVIPCTTTQPPEKSSATPPKISNPANPNPANLLDEVIALMAICL